MNTAKYKAEYLKHKKIKLFRLLVYISIISMILGVLYISIISKSEKTLVKNSFGIFFQNIETNQLNQIDLLINNILSNIVTTMVIWMLGISIIGVPISILYLIIKGFVFGFTISSLIYTYKIKGIIPCIIYCIPCLINFLVIFILIFYAINFSKQLYLYLFKGKDFNLKKRVKTYMRVLGISISILLVSAITSSYLVPILLKSFTNMLI